MKPSNLSIAQVQERLKQGQAPQAPRFTLEQTVEILLDKDKNYILTLERGSPIPDNAKIGTWRKEGEEDSAKRKAGKLRTWLAVTTRAKGSHVFTFRHAEFGDVSFYASSRKNGNIAGPILKIEDLKWEIPEADPNRWRQFKVIGPYNTDRAENEDSEHDESDGEEDEIEEEKEGEVSESPSERHGSKRPRPPVHIDLAGELNRRQANPGPAKLQKSKPVNNEPKLAANWKVLFEQVRADETLIEATEQEFDRRMEIIALEMAMNFEPIKQKALAQLNLRYDEKLAAVIAESKEAVEKKLGDAQGEFYKICTAKIREEIVQKVEAEEGDEIRRVARAEITARVRQEAELSSFKQRMSVSSAKEPEFEEIDGLSQSLKETFEHRMALL